MKATSSDAMALQRAPTTLLTAAILIVLSLLLAGAEWWSDRQGYDWTIATIIVPQTRFPSSDFPVKADGSILINPAEDSQDKTAREADSKRYSAMMARKESSIVLIGVMFVAAFGCGVIAWKRMLGRRWSCRASILCILCRNTFMVAMFITGAAFVLADPTAFSLLVALPCLALGVLGMAFGFAGTYRTLHVPPNDAESEISLPPSWLPLLAATIVTATALFISGGLWLEGKQREQRAEADRLSMESAAIAKAFAEDVLKSGKAKYPNRKAWKQEHPFDHRFDDAPF
jgi:hypothetical protein